MKSALSVNLKFLQVLNIYERKILRSFAREVLKVCKKVAESTEFDLFTNAENLKICQTDDESSADFL